MQHTQTNSQVLSADGETPIRLVTIQGIPFWQAGGRTFPQVAGAEDPPPGDAKGDENKGDPPGKKPGEGGGDGDDGDFDKDRALATIRKLREKERLSEAQAKELKELRSKVKEREDADKSEAERLRARTEELEAENAATKRELQETHNRQAIERAAVKAGATDPDDIFRLLDPSEFERDDSGKLTNAEELVKDLLKKKPYLVGKGTNGVPATPRSNGTQTHEDRVKENVEKLKASGLYNPL